MPLHDIEDELRFPRAVRRPGICHHFRRHAEPLHGVVHLVALRDRDALVGFAVILTVVLSFYGIIITHKVAGPLYKVSNYLDRIAAGKLGVVYNLRKGDELVDFFEHFKAAHDALRNGATADVVLLEKIEKAIEPHLGAHPELAALVDELKSTRKQKAESLNPG